MGSAKAKPDPFTAHVLAASAKSSAKPIAKALGALVAARLRKRQRTTQQTYRAAPVLDTVKAVKTRRSARRRGRNQHYRVTAKVDISRLGTFRHYMLATIRKHEWTWNAETEHADCDNPKFAKNKLDFSWAAAEGYIEFI
jgi:stage V sporulation protein SpoVS